MLDNKCPHGYSIGQFPCHCPQSSPEGPTLLFLARNQHLTHPDVACSCLEPPNRETGVKEDNAPWSTWIRKIGKGKMAHTT